MSVSEDTTAGSVRHGTSLGTAALEFSNIVKTYPGVRAVDDVSLTVLAGEVHALVGENGAGKSTLMGIAAGVTHSDSGSVKIDGRLLDHATPARSTELGLAIVYQHSSTISDLTIRENLVLSAPRDSAVHLRTSKDFAARVIDDSGLHVHPDTRVSSLSTAERQLLEIGKALAFQAKVLVLDEPTESLTQDETERLFTRIREVTSGGTAVVYISHRLADVRQISDRLTVLRDGRSRGTFSTQELTQLEVVELMIGRSLNHTFPSKSVAVAADPVLSVHGFSGAEFHDIDLEVAPGEVIGIAGVEGNGQRAFVRALAGLDASSGAIRINGETISIGSVRSAQKRGVYYLPGDRHLEGLVMTMSVAENATLLTLPQLRTAGLISRVKERAESERIVQDFDVRTPSTSTLVSNLSGGNQQKVLLGRVVAPRPRVLLVEEPTRGVDVGARAEIYVKLRELAAGGVAVVVLSSDAVELAGLCDRVVVFSRGCVAGVLSGDDLTEHSITSTALTAVVEKQSKEVAVVKGRGAGSRFLAGDYLPSAVVIGLLITAAVATQSLNSLFLSPYNVFTLLVLTSILIVASFGQTMVIYTGGIDLSIGPVIAVSVVTLSHFASAEAGAGGLATGILVVLASAVAIGLVNALLTRTLGLPSVLSTLITGITLQGVALLLRPVPGGSIGSPMIDLKVAGAGVVPYAFLAICVLGVGLEVALKWSRRGLQLRATGADEIRARTLGARVEVSHFSAYVLSAVLASVGGIVLASVVGIGNAASGLNYTLLTVTVAVLAGTSVFGGRGTIVGVIPAALLLQTLNSSTSFLQLGTAWQYWLPAILILAGAATFSRIRQSQVVNA